MFRARLASLVLAAGFLTLSGCTSSGSGFRPFHRQNSDCGCCGQTDVVGAVSGFDGPALVPTDVGTPQAVPMTAPPPRIDPIPQAAPVPYRPTGLRKLFGGS